jgi:urocanate hydratase
MSAFEVESAAAIAFIAQVEASYTSLVESASADRDAGLGGRLLYAGEIDRAVRALVVAANIAGATSLAATADRGVQKQAMRDGIVDFLVGSLDEALRILKNQLRKREPVAVCVALAPDAVEGEMRERGVLPDLVRDKADGLGGERGAKSSSDSTSSLVVWSVASAPARWLPKLDAIALDCLDPDAWRARRWLRLASRYLGRAAQALRLLRCDAEFAARFAERVRRQVECGEIAASVEMQIRDAAGSTEELRIEPRKNA